MFSLIHAEASASADRLMLASAVAVATVVADLLGSGGEPITIKWPNDVLIGGRKARASSSKYSQDRVYLPGLPGCPGKP